MANNVEIAYQNKDIISKVFGERMKGKPISLFGLDSSLKVVDIRPTNIPAVQAKELRMDNVFELEDGSVAILDYESTWKKENFIKYGFYVLHIADRYLKEGEAPDIHMMVLYTADIEDAPSDFHRTALDVRVEPAYMTVVNSEEWMREVREGIEKQEITDELLMHLVLLPLTYKGEEEKQWAIRDCVELACQVEDREKETFALAGILTLTDKVISKESREQIKGVLNMTQVGMMIFNDGWEQGREAGMEAGMEAGREESKRESALNMLKKGFDYPIIAEISGVSEEQVKAWEQEACAAM